MINDTNLKQEGGKNSTNVQAQLVVLNQGLSYQDVKGIAIDVFKSNFVELSEKAYSTAMQRVTEFTDTFVAELEKRKPQAIQSVEDPGLQHAIFTSQKDYARTGDKELGDMLIDILVDRAAQPERTLKQIVLDESLSVVSKLTSSQLDTLTILFLIKYTVNHSIKNLETFRIYFEKNLKPFVSNLSKENSLYQHLEFTGCASVSMGQTHIERIFSINYKGIFCKGWPSSEIVPKLDSLLGSSTYLLVPSDITAGNLRINAMNDDSLASLLSSLDMVSDKQEEIWHYMNANQMSEAEIRKFVCQMDDTMDCLFSIWYESSLKNCKLTSVGIAIAAANFRRKTGETIELDEWIK